MQNEKKMFKALILFWNFPVGGVKGLEHGVEY